jgi:hypothetical protein
MQVRDEYVFEMVVMVYSRKWKVQERRWRTIRSESWLERCRRLRQADSPGLPMAPRLKDFTHLRCSTPTRLCHCSIYILSAPASPTYCIMDRWAPLATTAAAVVFSLGFWAIPDPGMDWSREMIPRVEVVDLARTMRTRWTMTFSVIAFVAVACFRSGPLLFAPRKRRALSPFQGLAGGEAKEDTDEHHAVPKETKRAFQPEEAHHADLGAGLDEVKIPQPSVDIYSRQTSQIYRWNLQDCQMEELYERVKRFDINDLDLPRPPPGKLPTVAGVDQIKETPEPLWVLFKDSLDTELKRFYPITYIALDDANLGVGSRGEFKLTQTAHCKGDLYAVNKRLLMIEVTDISLDLSSEFRPDSNPSQRLEMHFLPNITSFGLFDVRASNC